MIITTAMPIARYVVVCSPLVGGGAAVGVGAVDCVGTGCVGTDVGGVDGCGVMIAADGALSTPIAQVAEDGP